MPQRFAVTRRNLLRTAPGLLFLSPLLRARHLQAQSRAPRRLLLCFTPDSAPQSFWPQTGGGAHGFTLTPSMQAFAGLEEHMLFIRELNHTFTSDNHHLAGIVQCFTGQPHSSDAQKFALGPSLDQVAAPHIFGNTPRRSIHLAVDDGRTDSRHIICYTGPHQPILNELNPRTAFDTIFSGADFDGPVGGGGPTADPLVNLQKEVRRKILALSTEELRSMQRLLGQDERQKLELHIDSLAELRRQIDLGSGGMGEDPDADDGIPDYLGGVCERVPTAGTFDLRSTANIDAWIKVQSDIILAAFQCDRTRVASLQLHFSGAHLGNLMGDVLRQGTGGGTSWHDDVAHLASARRSLYDHFHEYHAQKIAYIAQRLASMPDVDGRSFLDNTLIVWGFEVGTDHNHSRRDMPYLLIGGRGFGIKTGQFLRNSSSRDAQEMHTAILNALGVPAAGFGERPTCGPLPGMLA